MNTAISAMERIEQLEREVEALKAQIYALTLHPALSVPPIAVPITWAVGYRPDYRPEINR